MRDPAAPAPRSFSGGRLLPLRAAVLVVALAALARGGSPDVTQGATPAGPSAYEPRVAPPMPNILLIIGDDIGVDRLAAYGEHPDPGNTPALDSLAQQGILFRNVWANPSCSPSRATILTGRYAFRTGIGGFINCTDDVLEVSTQEVSVADLLQPTHLTAAFGKWHLTSSSLTSYLHPLQLGFTHAGSLCSIPDYFNWEKTVDGVLTQSMVYNTTDIADDVVRFVESNPEPWFLWVGMNAPHLPYHKPPDELHSFDLPGPTTENKPLHHRAMTEAMDTEIGRILTSMPPDVLANTVVLFVGDNGTQGEATDAPFYPAHAKGTTFEGGINVPLIVAGPGIAAGAECDALVNTTDLYATIAELAGVFDHPAEDSVSLVPYFSQPDQPSLRPWVYSERFGPNGFGPYAERQRTVRDRIYKLRYLYDGSPEPTGIEFYNLLEDPFEQNEIGQQGPTLEELAAFDALALVLEGLER